MILPVRRRLHPDVLVIVLLVLIYFATTLPSLGNDPLAGGDEGWIISAAAKLADQGTFGSDLFSGFFGAEDHYYFNLPLHHLVLAGWFKVAGVSLSSARLVSVIYGLVALLLTAMLGRRVGGPWAGAGAAALFVLLRLNLTPFTGLTLTDLGATVRYDLVTVPYGLGAALLLLHRRHTPEPLGPWTYNDAAPGAPLRDAVEPRLLFVLLAGLLLGLAALTQFVGAMFGPPLALYLLTLPHVSAGRRLMFAAVLTIAAVLPFVPYAAYINRAPDDFRGQARAVEQSTAFASASFYIEQVQSEPSRFRDAVALGHVPHAPGDLVKRPSARLALLVLLPLSLLWVLWRAVEWRSEPHRLLAFMLIGLAVELALLESTKRFVYWVVVVPFVCIAIADLLQAWCIWARERMAEHPAEWQPRATLLAVAAIVLLFAVEGLSVAARDVRDARDTGDYEALAKQLEAVVPPGAVTMGDNRLWPAMRCRPFRSLHLLFYETNPRISKEQTTDIPGVFQRAGVEYLLLSPLSRGQLEHLSPRDSADFQSYVETNMELVTTIDDPVYGPIEVYRIPGERQDAGSVACD